MISLYGTFNPNVSMCEGSLISHVAAALRIFLSNVFFLFIILQALFKIIFLAKINTVYLLFTSQTVTEEVTVCVRKDFRQRMNQ